MARHLSFKEVVVNLRAQTPFLSSCNHVPRKDRRELLRKLTSIRLCGADQHSRHPHRPGHQLSGTERRLAERPLPIPRRQHLLAKNRRDTPVRNYIPPGLIVAHQLSTNLIIRVRGSRQDVLSMRTRRQMVSAPRRVVVTMDLLRYYLRP